MNPPDYTACSVSEHNAIKTRVEYFMLETEGHEKWAGLLTGHCRLCSSTLALVLCQLCDEACPTSDSISWGPSEDDVAHVECVMKVMLPTAKTRFVIVVGKATAHELVRA